ncbi:hypothetical protein Vretimale_8625 [Volvox reticuliferus]|uniref:Uncharacterized protein n=1 Tax=Volvox reticuliferus TaxID=1737510 RepID=A0A8J4C8K3_9CHLO|nr:hypothetical protein Vretifemale_6446 [Volvox reticuliferus]GIM03985.1 hypothetical protein Vretimale_8625 [Volvox reticuliferus]
MKFLLIDKAFGPYLPSTKSLEATYAAAFSALEPAPYSLPEPPTSSPSGKGSPRNLTSAAAVAAAAAAVSNPVTSLPGCAARPSMDLATERTKDPGGSAGNLFCCHQPDLRNPRDVRGTHCGTITHAAAVVEAVAALPSPRTVGAPRQHQQLVTAQPPPSRLCKQAPPGQRQSIQLERDTKPKWRNYRPSIDAAAGATMLYTSPGMDANPQSVAHVNGSPLAMAAAYEVPGLVPALAPLPFAQVRPPPQPPTSRTAAVGLSADQVEWNFGDNLQRARLLARYAAMAAAEEMRYDPGPSTAAAISSDSEVGSGGDKPSWKAHGPWRLLLSLLSSSRSSDGKSMPPSPPGRDGAECAGSEESPEPAVVRSRDSRRLLRVRRSRVGIDREGQKQKPLQPPSGRVSAPAFTVEYQQQRQQLKQQQQTQRQALSLGSAPQHRHGMRCGDVGDDDDDEEDGYEDELSAAVMTAAMEFAAAATERELLSP